jgi:hypothetical protein
MTAILRLSIVEAGHIKSEGCHLEYLTSASGMLHSFVELADLVKILAA